MGGKPKYIPTTARYAEYRLFYQSLVNAMCKKYGDLIFFSLPKLSNWALVVCGMLCSHLFHGEEVGDENLVLFL